MKITPNKKHRIVAYHDAHCPHEIDFSPILDFQHDYDPQFIVLNGDFLNMEYASHWSEPLFKEVGFGKLRKNILAELESGELLIDRIHKASPKAKILYVPGNHEKHLAWASIYYPALGIFPHMDVTKFDFKSDVARESDNALASILFDLLHADKYGMTVLPYNEELTIGHQTFLHGHQLSISNSPKLYPNKNIIFGHYHTETCITLNDGGDDTGENVVQHRAVPCMTKLGPFKPGYLGSKSTRWLNGFYVADVLANGLFDGRVKKILGGKVMIP